MCINYFINTCHLFTLYDSCVTISMHKVHHCTCISTSLYPPSQFVRTNFSTSFCCSVLHISYIFSIYCYSVAAVITVCAVSVCVSSHQPSFLIQHLICSTPTSKSLHSTVPLVRPLTGQYYGIAKYVYMTGTLYEYQYTSHFLQGLKLSFLKLGRVYHNLHGINVI